MDRLGVIMNKKMCKEHVKIGEEIAMGETHTLI
jgi:hypothetical protein